MTPERRPITNGENLTDTCFWQTGRRRSRKDGHGFLAGTGTAQGALCDPLEEKQVIITMTLPKVRPLRNPRLYRSSLSRFFPACSVSLYPTIWVHSRDDLFRSDGNFPRRFRVEGPRFRGSVRKSQLPPEPRAGANKLLLRYLFRRRVPLRRR